MNIIDFENLNISYDEKIVLKDINLKIKQGEHWAILGANGSGKSTLLKVIQSELHPRKVKGLKKEILGKSRYSIFDLKKQIGIITNDLHIYFQTHTPYLTGYEVVLSGFYATIGVFQHQDFTKKEHQKVQKVLEVLNIEYLKNKRVDSMSTGELRKTIVARALIHNPKAFILDEPTVGLDIKAQIDFINILRTLSQTSTIILVTHHLEEIFQEISNIALIVDSTIYKQGLKKEILTDNNLSYTFKTDIKLGIKNNRYFIAEVQEV